MKKVRLFWGRVMSQEGVLRFASPFSFGGTGLNDLVAFIVSGKKANGDTEGKPKMKFKAWIILE